MNVHVQTGNLTHNTTNDTRERDVLAQAREFGRNEALGDDAMAMAAQHFVRSVAEGAIDVTKDSNGDDAAARYYKEYAEAKGKKALHERTADGLKANISKLRQLQKMASCPKWDAVEIMERAYEIRKQAMDDDLEVKSAYPAYVDVARAQNAQDSELSDDAIKAAVCKSTEAKETTLEKEWAKIAKKIDALVTGENSAKLKDQSPEAIVIQEHVAQHVKLLELVAARQEAIDKAIKAGFRVDENGALSLPAAA